MKLVLKKYYFFIFSLQNSRQWSRRFPHNPCYRDYRKLVCGPAVYLIGIQFAGLDLLKQAIDLHPDVDCYSTGFFSAFSDMKGTLPPY